MRIQRRRTSGWRMPEGAIYVGRPTLWGNPLQVSPSLSMGGRYRQNGREAINLRRAGQAVAMYENKLRAGGLDFSVEDVRAQLRGRSLACWCLPDEPCHADVLLRIANE